MGKETGISWCHHTFNPWHGCVKVSPGCEHCYAETLSKRWGKDIWGPAKTTSRQLMSDAYWKQPLAWDRDAAEHGVRRLVFCASMADVFEDAPQIDGARRRLFGLIERTPNLIWLLLTKRPQNVMPMLSDTGYPGGPVTWLERMGDRVWMGTSVENQATAEQRIPQLTAIPAAIRFLSIEPLIERVDLETRGFLSLWKETGGVPRLKMVRPSPIHWMIVGGESGPHARPMHTNWVRELRRQSFASKVPFFFKQWGEWLLMTHAPDLLMLKRMPRRFIQVGGEWYYRAGKDGDPHTLDGLKYHEFPQVNGLEIP